MASQTGYANYMDINIHGNNNDIGYSQNGDKNYIQHSTYLNNGSGAIKQSGDGNEIRLNESGGNYLNGITVEQTGGMKAVITTSLKIN